MSKNFFFFISSLFFPNEVWQNILTVIDVLCQEKGVFEDSFSKKYDLKFNSKSLKKQSLSVLVHNSFNGIFQGLKSRNSEHCLQKA